MNKPEHVETSGAECACGRCHEAKTPIIVKIAERDGIPIAISEVVEPPPEDWDGMPTMTTDAVQTALETRAMLIAAEQACEEIGRKLSTQIRSFSAEELVAYASATQVEEEM